MNLPGYKKFATYISERRGPNTPPRTGVVGVAAPARERQASDAQNKQIRRQRKTQGRFDPFTINQGTEIKMNRYMHALIETRKGRDRLKIGRGRPGKVTHTKPKPKPPGEEGTKAADAEVTRLQDMPAPRPRTSQKNDWTEYQRIGRILAEVGSDSREEWLKTARPRGGSIFKPGEGPKDPRDMTPDERKDRDEKTAKLIVRRDAQRAESTRRSGTPEPRGGHRRRS